MSGSNASCWSLQFVAIEKISEESESSSESVALSLIPQEQDNELLPSLKLSPENTRRPSVTDDDESQTEFILMTKDHQEVTSIPPSDTEIPEEVEPELDGIASVVPVLPIKR